MFKRLEEVTLNLLVYIENIVQAWCRGGQENSAFDPCVRAFNCVRLCLRKFNLHALVP